MLGCLAEISGQSVIVIGTEKGNSMESRIKHNFGMAKPEGYRKAQRLMNIADKYNLPIITFVDTAGAFQEKMLKKEVSLSQLRLQYKLH